jgi:hypothetical protein
MAGIDDEAIAAIGSGATTGGCTMPTALIVASSSASACGWTWNGAPCRDCPSARADRQTS